jgi:hypothetical protein
MCLVNLTGPSLSPFKLKPTTVHLSWTRVVYAKKLELGSFASAKAAWGRKEKPTPGAQKVQDREMAHAVA